MQDNIDRYIKSYNLNMDPDFQRGHVWSEKQQIAFIEYVLRDGKSGREILFNCPGFMSIRGESGPMVLVDGKQRITAVNRFLANEIPVFGKTILEYEDGENWVKKMTGPDFYFVINNLRTRKEVLNWYLGINSGGTPHSEEEINRIKGLLESL